MAKLTDMPVEVLREIASYIFWDTARSASRVCKYLTPVFQEPLFTRVHLDDRYLFGRSNPKTPKFISVVQTSPHLVKYIESFSASMSYQDLVAFVLAQQTQYRPKIKKLQLRDDRNEPIEDDDEYPNESYEEDDYMEGYEEDESAYEISEEEEFSEDDEIGYIPWQSYKPETRSAISKAFEKLPLTEVYIHCMEFPLSLLAQCKNLKVLSLTKLLVDSNDPSYLKMGEQPITLESLQLQLDSDNLPLVTNWLLNPQCPFDIRNLKNLYLNSEKVSSTSDNTCFWNIIRRCIASLEILELDINNASVSDNNSFHKIIPKFPKLQRIHVRLPSSDADINALYTVFNQFPKVDSLKELWISIILPRGDMGYYEADCNTVVYKLFKRDVFSKMRVCIVLYNCESHTEEHAQEEMMDQWVTPKANIELHYDFEDCRDLFLDFNS